MMVMTVMEIMMIITRMEIMTMKLTLSCSLLRLLVARADGLAVKVASDFRPIRLLFPFGIKCRAPTSH